MEKIDPVMVDEAPPKQEEKPVDPAAQAAHNMPAMLGWFKHLVNDKMGGVHAKRVLVALSEVPFNNEEPHFTTKDQEEAYILGQQIFNAKFLILMASLRDAAEKKNNESKTEKKEEENGDQKV